MTPSNHFQEQRTNAHQNIFIGDSEMATLMRNYEWEEHPLGDPQSWPVSLKSGIRIVLNAAQPMFIWWSKELYMFYNDSYMPLMGNKHRKGAGAKGNEIWEEIWHQIGEVVETILQGGAPYFAEEMLIPMTRKGFKEDTYWTFSYSPIFDDVGKVNGIFCACTEVTESVLSKRRLNTIKEMADFLIGLPSLEQACKKTCAVLDHNAQKDIPFSLIYLLSDGNSNAKLAGATGNAPKEIAPLEVDLMEHQNKSPWPLQEVVNTKKHVVVDIDKLLNHTKNESAKFSSKAIVYPILQPGKVEVMGFFVFGLSPFLELDNDYLNFQRLITSKLANFLSNIKGKLAVANQKARLERLFLQAPAAVCILSGPDLVYELVNPGYQALFPQRKLIGRPILEALPEIANNDVYKTFRKVYETGVTHEEQAFYIPFARPEDGLLEDRYFKYIQQARYDEEGNIDGVLVFAYEVTELVVSRIKLQESTEQLAAINEELSAANEEIRASNEELLDSNLQLKRINTDLDNFIYTASHDLKAPISNIEGLLQAMLRSLSNENIDTGHVQNLTSMMQQSTERFKKTIANLTEITKLQREHDQAETLVRIEAVMQEVILDMETILQEAEVDLSIDLSDCELIRFSEKNLRSILYNLLSNAVKYRSPDRKPVVKVACTADHDYYILSVKDNGLGMDLSGNDKMFTMFKRFHDHVEGSGIGLYMVKRIIENAGGMVDVESEEGVGSTFRVYFKK